MKLTRYMTVSGVQYRTDDDKIRIRRPLKEREWLLEIYEDGAWQEISRFERFEAAKKAAGIYKKDSEKYMRYLR